ncbi:hypothetical protein BHE74_00021860 [Ensete ventricosum]|nr:hypothetical protein BHE74_00021860 [Ensete ventricosum]RZR88972.1 hypothetical protein BHM03_00016629 [Ensete ventricosum]
MQVGSSTFEVKFQPHLVWKLDQVKQNIEGQAYQHIDARSKARMYLFCRCWIAHKCSCRQMNLPKDSRKQVKLCTFCKIENCFPCCTWKSPLSFIFAGMTMDRPVVASCGTGVTACVLALGLHRLGKTDVAVYDGSWTEWGSQSDTPVTTA